MVVLHSFDSRSTSAPDGSRIMYRVRPGPGIAVLFADSLLGSWRAWRGVFDELDRSERLISWQYVGLLGTRWTSSNDAIVLQEVANLRAVMEAEHIAQAVIVGWGFGGTIALAAASLYPSLVRGVVLVNGWYGYGFGTSRGLQGLELLLQVQPQTLLRRAPTIFRLLDAALSWERFIPIMQRLGFLSRDIDSDTLLEVLDDLLLYDPRRVLSCILSALSFNVREMVPLVRAPALLICADRDWSAPVDRAKEIARALARAEVLHVPGSTHFLPLEHPELISSAIADFIDELDATTAKKVPRSPHLRVV